MLNKALWAETLLFVLSSVLFSLTFKFGQIWFFFLTYHVSSKQARNQDELLPSTSCSLPIRQTFRPWQYGKIRARQEARHTLVRLGTTKPLSYSKSMRNRLPACRLKRLQWPCRLILFISAVPLSTVIMVYWHLRKERVWTNWFVFVASLRDARRLRSLGEGMWLSWLERRTGQSPTQVQFLGAANLPESTFSEDFLTVTLHSRVQSHAFISVRTLKIP